MHSRWVGNNAAASGIDRSRVKVIPHGIDEAVFKPGGGAYGLPTDRSFKFLFVGATVFRKGIDVLLEAFGAAFNAGDDVCLVIAGPPTPCAEGDTTCEEPGDEGGCCSAGSKPAGPLALSLLTLGLVIRRRRARRTTRTDR